MKSNMHFGISITVPTTEKYWFIWLVFIPKQTKISAQAHCRAKFTRKELIQISQDIVSPIHVRESYVRARLFTRENMKRNKVCESRKKSGTQWCSAMFSSNNKKENKNLSFFRFPTDPERWDSNWRLSLYSSFR